MSNEAHWTIDDLGARVAIALSRDYAGQSNRQVSDIPNGRTIRYYTTIGLVDRPARMRGRTGLYGPRHLLQIVAVKRLQVRGLSLAQIQGALTGASDEKLNEIADISDKVGTDTLETSTDETDDMKRLDEPFWRSAPVPVEEAEQDESVAETGVSRFATTLVPGIRITESVVLLIEAGRPIYDDDIAAIEAAAAPLLKVLHQRGLARR
jgi:DNA-binding transcriptional MerR regulator